MFDMSGVRNLRRAAKFLHEVASIGFGGGLAVCLLINVSAKRALPDEFMAARHVYASVAQYIVIPSMVIVVASGLIALAATRGFMDSGWAWVKALLGLSVFEATLMFVGSSRHAAEIALAASDSAVLDALLRSERNTLLLLIVVTVVNVVLAVWRPSLVYKVR
jgi:uncharacterized membrane protein